MIESIYKSRSKMLINDSTKNNTERKFLKRNMSKVLVVALCINFCLAVTFFSLYVTKIEDECICTLYPPPMIEKGY